MVQARIPDVGERVTFAKHAKALPGNSPLEGEEGTVVEIENHGESGGYSHVDVWVETDLYEDGKRIVVACSPVELDGMVLQ